MAGPAGEAPSGYVGRPPSSEELLEVALKGLRRDVPPDVPEVYARARSATLGWLKQEEAKWTKDRAETFTGVCWVRCS